MSTDRNLTLRLVTWRWLTGMPIDGKSRTNATLIRKGTAATSTAQIPRAFSFLPRYQRASLRILLTAYMALLVYAVFVFPWFMYVNLALLICAAITSVVLSIYERRQGTSHERIPSSVKFKDVEDMLSRIDGYNTPLIGLTYGKVPVCLDLDNDAPHVALSMGVGAGKSSFLRGVIAQLLRGGVEHITIIDPKLISLREFDGHPRVTICNTYPTMWAGVVNFRTIMDERYQQIASGAAEMDSFKRRVLIMEEGNSFAAEIRTYWLTVLNGRGQPPIITDLALILFKGRQARCNVIGSWQRLSVAVVGSSDARDQFGLKVLARFSQSAWKSLVGTSPVPPSVRHRGRAIAAVGEDQTSIQMVMWSEAQARMWAEGVKTTEELESDASKDSDVSLRDGVLYLGKQPLDVSTLDTGANDTFPPSLQLAIGSSNTRSSDAPPAEGDSDMKSESAASINLSDIPVTLAEALKLELVTGLTLKGLRTARQRKGKFPEPIDKRGLEMLYSSVALRAWNQERLGNVE